MGHGLNGLMAAGDAWMTGVIILASVIVIAGVIWGYL
jgi:hypothetical protein